MTKPYLIKKVPNHSTLISVHQTSIGIAYLLTHKKINQTHYYSCARMPLIRHTKLLIGAGTSPTHKLVLFVNRCTVFVVVSGFPILIAHRPGTDVFGHTCVTQTLIWKRLYAICTCITFVTHAKLPSALIRTRSTTCKYYRTNFSAETGISVPVLEAFYMF